LEPNYSFDLCRLACSLFDHLIEDMSEVEDLSKCSPLVRLIVDWCTDDKGINVLYKRNGDERYPDFKLYKMIARCVHNHTPCTQLERPEFAKFLVIKKDFPEDAMCVHMDAIPVYTNSVSALNSLKKV